MADPVVIDPAQAAPAAEPSAIISENTATPPVESTAASAQADQTAPSSAPTAEATPAVGATEAKPADAALVPEPTLLDKFDAEKAGKDAKPEDKPADAPKPEDAKPDAAKPEDAPKDGEPEKPQVEEPAPLDPIDYYAEEGGLVIPETIKLADEQRTELTAALDKFRANPSGANAQSLIDMHVKAIEQVAADHTAKMWEAFSDVRKGWREQVMADPVMGGAGHDTAMGKIARMRDMLVSSAKPGTDQYAKDLDAFTQMTKATGVGDNPAFLRILHNAARFFDEATVPPPNPKPPPAPRAPRGKGALYNNTNFPK